MQRSKPWQLISQIFSFKFMNDFEIVFSLIYAITYYAQFYIKFYDVLVFTQCNGKLDAFEK